MSGQNDKEANGNDLAVYRKRLSYSWQGGGGLQAEKKPVLSDKDMPKRFHERHKQEKEMKTQKNE